MSALVWIVVALAAPLVTGLAALFLADQRRFWAEEDGGGHD